MLPEFLLVGAAKAGSTTIHDVLDQHRDIYLPAAKELHFFDDDSAYAKGRAWYESNFTHARAGQIAGEATPAYMSYPATAQRINETLGEDVKLIFSLREPVSRAYSEFLHNRRRGFLEGNFEEAIEKEFDAKDLSVWERRKFSFISRGYYARQISGFLKIFPRENMFFVILEEDLRDKCRETIISIQDFLGVQRQELDISKRSNPAYNPRSASGQRFLYADNWMRRLARTVVRSGRIRRRMRKTLIDLNASSDKPGSLPPEVVSRFQNRFFDSEIGELEEILQRDLSIWRTARESDERV